MPPISAGLLMVRKNKIELEFFLIHPGGPYYAHKNDGTWSIPKGLVEAGESLEGAAIREFQEETGIVPKPPYHSLGSVVMKSGKIVHAWAFAGNWDSTSGISSNIINLEWPPRSGKFIEVPEADKGGWFMLEEAIKLIHGVQVEFLKRAVTLGDLVK